MPQALFWECFDVEVPRDIRVNADLAAAHLAALQGLEVCQNILGVIRDTYGDVE